MTANDKTSRPKIPARADSSMKAKPGSQPCQRMKASQIVIGYDSHLVTQIEEQGCQLEELEAVEIESMLVKLWISRQALIPAKFCREGEREVWTRVCMRTSKSGEILGAIICCHRFILTPFFSSAEGHAPSPAVDTPSAQVKSSQVKFGGHSDR